MNLSEDKRQTRAPRRVPAALLLSGALLVISGAAVAGHATSTLPGSDFEIDDDANLTVDHVTATSGRPSIDWLEGDSWTPGVLVMDDEPSGSNDDAFGKGSKEDTAVPALVAGSIPPNKSDLKHFGVFTERNSDGAFLHLFWTRGQDPSGTTLMDFEFNREKCDPSDPGASVCSANGVTPVRTVDDLLLTYELSQGGTVPNFFLYRWLGSAADGACEASNKYPCWGTKTALAGGATVTGSINTSTIDGSDSDGLGELEPRTFGEASVNLDAIFDPSACESFGSAYLKSRSSDSFTAALKDFIAPQAVTLTNCGTVTIRKKTDPGGGTGFQFSHTVLTDPPGDLNDLAPPGGANFVLDDNQSMSSSLVVSGGPYVVEEVNIPAGYDLTGIDCGTSDVMFGDGTTFHADYLPGDTAISFTQTVGGTVDCTFTNTARGKILVEKVTIPDGSTQSFEFNPSWDTNFFLQDGDDAEDSGFLEPGTYTVQELVPDGWDLTNVTFTTSDGTDSSSWTGQPSDTATIDLDPGETITVTFTNKTGAILITKVTKDAADAFDATNNPNGDGLSLLAGVTFEIKDGPGALVATVVTDGDGEACVDGLTVGASYTITETLAPTGYDPTSAAAQIVVAAAAEGCGETDAGTPAPANFVNDPLSEIVITFYSLAGDGVTLVTNVYCIGPSADGSEQGPLDDGENATFTDLKEGTYICTIIIDP